MSTEHLFKDHLRWFGQYARVGYYNWQTWPNHPEKWGKAIDPTVFPRKQKEYKDALDRLTTTAW